MVSQINELIKQQVLISSHCLKGMKLEQGQWFGVAVRSGGVLQLSWCRRLYWSDTGIFLPSFVSRASAFPGWIRVCGAVVGVSPHLAWMVNHCVLP